MSSKAKLIILSARFPFPLEKGDKLRLFHQIRFLQDFFEIHLISLTEEIVQPDDLVKMEQFCQSIRIIKQGSFLNAKAVVKSFFSQDPLQLSYYYSRKSHEIIEGIIQELNPSAIYVQLVRMTKYVSSLSIPVIVDLMDAMSLNMSRESEMHKFPLSYMYKRESRLLKKAEVLVTQKHSLSTIISNADKKHLEKNGCKDLKVISNGVDTAYFNRHAVMVHGELYDVVFVGNMGYLPNVEAAEFIVKRILNKTMSLSIHIAGARPSPRVLSLGNANVTISGWVSDIRQAYLSAKIMVAPIFSGAGQQNKILEAMSLGIACVTTSQANAAIGAKEDQELLIADNPEEFRDKINLLLNNETLRQTIGKNARIFVVQNYQWEVQGKLLAKAINQVLQ